MKLLFVAMSSSIHTARWISQIADQGWEIYLFPSIESESIHPELKNIKVYRSLYGQKGSSTAPSVRSYGIPLFSDTLSSIVHKITKKIFPDYRAYELKCLIKKIKPDIIHTLETQNAGYLTAKTKKLLHEPFPLWIHSNWGIDLHFYGKLEAHKKQIREVLSSIDCFIYEGDRDKRLAIEQGFDGQLVFITPVGGGYDLESFLALRRLKLPSERKIILVKGYQNEVRRALVALRALERCADILSGYDIVIYSASPDVVVKAELMTKLSGINIRIISHTTHDQMFKILADTRISITVNLSDGLPNSMLEAMIMGAFPIQSWTSCADEWIEDGVSGLLVPPEDPDVIEKAIRRALSDDELVNGAAEQNWKTVSERLDKDILKHQIVEFYKTMADKKGVRLCAK